MNLAKPQRVIDDEYRAFVKAKPCCLRGVVTHLCKGSSEPHHVSARDGSKGTGSKVSDRRCVPVCFYGHRSAEQQPNMLRQFFNGIIAALNAEYDARHPVKPKPLRKRPMKAKALITGCCSVDHRLSWARVTIKRVGSRNVLHFRCPVTNEEQKIAI